MTIVSNVEIYRDGGTLDFKVSDSAADGPYRQQTPFGGIPEPLFKDNIRLAFGSVEERALLSALQEWLTAVSTGDVVEALAELENLKVWQNLPDRLAGVVPVYYVRTVVERLLARCT